MPEAYIKQRAETEIIHENGKEWAIINAETLRRLDLFIAGMNCASCVARIEKTHSQTDGVAEAKVNLATESAVITYDPARIDPADFLQTIRDVGYQPKVEKVSVPIQGMSPGTDVCGAQLRSGHDYRVPLRTGTGNAYFRYGGNRQRS